MTKEDSDVYLLSRSNPRAVRLRLLLMCPRPQPRISVAVFRYAGYLGSPLRDSRRQPEGNRYGTGSETKGTAVSYRSTRLQYQQRRCSALTRNHGCWGIESELARVRQTPSLRVPASSCVAADQAQRHPEDWQLDIGQRSGLLRLTACTSFAVYVGYCSWHSAYLSLVSA